MKDFRPTKNSSDAWVISDRSGMRYRMRDTEKEQGTHFRVAKKESDGIWNQVDHPQANLQKYAILSGDPYPVDDARPDIKWADTVPQSKLDAHPVYDSQGVRIL
jgi:hypothetical protein